MNPALSRVRAIVALSCCIVVLVVITAYLAHTAHHYHHSNAKAMEDSACSLCAFSASATPVVVHELPAPTGFVAYHFVAGDQQFVAFASIRLETGRAPPALS